MEEESKTTKQMLEDKIRECIEGLKYTEQGEEQHARLTGDIQKLVSAFVELDKAEYAKADSDRKFNEDVRMNDLKLYYNDMLERDKMQDQTKSAKRDAFIKIGDLLARNGLYFLSIGAAMLFEFKMHGSITSFSAKELFRAIHPKI